MKSIPALILFVFAGISATGQIVFDLSDKKPTTETIDLKTSPVLLIKSMIAELARGTDDYKIEINLSEEDVPPLSFASLAGDPCVQDATNGPLKVAVASLINETDEQKIPSKISAVEEKRNDLTKIDKKKYAVCIGWANDAITSTTYLKHLQFSLKPNQTIVVKVTRGAKEWEKTFKTIEKSPWLVHFGFTYQLNVLRKYDQFYSQQIGKSDSFYVKKKYSDELSFLENLSPTVLFTFPVTKKGDFKFGITAMASTNFTSLSAGAGISAVIATNLLIGTGVCFSQKYALRGEYNPDGTQVIKSNLTYDQLHEKKWGPEMFVTIGLRLDKNPQTSTDAAKK